MAGLYIRPVMQGLVISPLPQAYLCKRIHSCLHLL